MALSKPLKSPLTHSATSITSSWLISYLKPVVQLVIHKIPRSFKPEQATTITSGAVDIPTTSVPSILQVRISTRVQIQTRALPFCLYSSKISSNHVNVALPQVWLLTSSVLSTTSKQCFELTSSVISTTSKQCFEQPAASFLVYSLIFIEY